VELERVRDARGAGFGFKVNGAPVFAKGANWIPADSFLPRVSRPRVEALVDRAYEANYTMLRVWGGGVYEDEAFYGACDRKGLLVWQDFPFACGEAPEAPAFLAQVREEASSALKRLRRHPSLALLCGNNENHMARHDRWFGAASAKRWGRPIYHRTLPQVCARQAPGIPYWPGSPYGGSDPNDPGEGDRHHWAVWAHFAAPEEYLKDEGRFLSEFGFAALPGRAALADALGPRGRWPEGPELPAHDKVENGGGLGRIAYYLSGRLPQARDLDSLRYLSQTLQARVLKAGVEHWRRLKPHTQGALVWQHNDCWPAVSWSLLDGRDEPKLAYHAIAAAFEDIHLSAVESAGLAEFWLSCDGLSPQGTLRVERWNVRGREAVLLRSRARGSALKGVRVFRATRAQAGIIDPSRQFLAAFWEGPQGLRRRALLFFAQPLRLALTRPQARLAARVCDGVWMLELRAATLTLACEVSGPSPSGFSDNGFDLLPGERREITWKGAPPGRPPRWSLRTLNALVVHG
jgi:beta-mannosidase